VTLRQKFCNSQILDLFVLTQPPIPYTKVTLQRASSYIITLTAKVILSKGVINVFLFMILQKFCNSPHVIDLKSICTCSQAEGLFLFSRITTGLPCATASPRQDVRSMADTDQLSSCEHVGSPEVRTPHVLLIISLL
jgi:hypothetical protein